MNRNYELALPTSYLEVDNEKMEYVDGVGTISIIIGKNSFLIGMLAALGTSLTMAKVTAVLVFKFII